MINTLHTFSFPYLPDLQVLAELGGLFIPTYFFFLFDDDALLVFAVPTSGSITATRGRPSCG